MLNALRRHVIERLNSLLRDELAAVAGYQKALGVLRKKAVADGENMLRLASDHQRTVAALHGSVQARGGVPVAAAAAWEGSNVAALTAEGSSLELNNRGFVSALLEVERRGLAEYEDSLSALDADAQELVAFELIPRQRRHVEALSAMLAQLAA
jgi:bacterioferritin (cytochrome b1)